MLNYNEILPRKFIVFENEPYEVMSSNTAKKDRQKPVNKTKLKNLLNGRVVEMAFHQSDKVDEADISKRIIKYLYSNKGEFWFSDPKNPQNRFQLEEDVIGDNALFLKENNELVGLAFNDDIIGISLPVKMDFRVTEAPPGIKGNTAQGGTKVITLETGATVSTPLFINEGDIVRINTETNEYVERVEKK
ncbi:elongation factor P [Candidatus Kaiserbacteria bacterium]|nr:elongation factor P [Candidatus Kaiserbacteria bacterium]